MKEILAVLALILIVYLIWGMEGVLWLYVINQPILWIALILLGIAEIFRD